MWWIEIPLLKPVLLVAILLRLIDSIKNIDLIIVITQGGPGTSTEIRTFMPIARASRTFRSVGEPRSRFLS